MQKCKCWGAKWTKKGGVGHGEGAAAATLKRLSGDPLHPRKRQHCAEAEVINAWVEWISGVRGDTAVPRATPRPWAGMDLTALRGSTDPLACLPQMSDGGREPVRGGWDVRAPRTEKAVRPSASVSPAVGAAWTERACQEVSPWRTVRSPWSEDRGGVLGKEDRRCPPQSPGWSVSGRGGETASWATRNKDRHKRHRPLCWQEKSERKTMPGSERRRGSFGGWGCPPGPSLGDVDIQECFCGDSGINHSP